MAGRRRRWPWVLGGVALVVVVVAMLALPIWLRAQIVGAFNDSERYDARLDDVGIGWTGPGLTLSGLVVEDLRYGVTALDADEIAVGLDFGALLRGEIRLKVEIPEPYVGIVMEPTDPEVADREMRALLDDLREQRAMTIDRFEISGATVVLDPTDQPFSVSLEDVDIVVENVRNRPAPKGEQPTRLELDARMSEGGTLRVEAQADVMSPSADMDLMVDIRALDLPAFSAALEEAADLKLTDGTMSFHLDAALRDGAYAGDVAGRLDEVEIDTTDEAAALEEVVAGLSGPAFGAVAWITITGGVPRSTEFEGELDERHVVFTRAMREVTSAAISALLDVPVVGPLIPDPTG